MVPGIFATALVSGSLALSMALPAAAQPQPTSRQGVAPPNSGREPLTDEQATALKNGLMSPFCPGRTLSGCNSSGAAEWRAEIDAWAAQGVSEAEIKRRLQARVPDFTLDGTPRGHWSWSLPVIAVLLATGALLLYVLWTRRNPPSLVSDVGDSPERDVDNDESDRLDDALDEELAHLE